ncbi:MAG: hypothetical protein CMJ85_13985 [Planctomycetes bacterium]|nr:hypothetical protein [Planctomycetota bacterium]
MLTCKRKLPLALLGAALCVGGTTSAQADTRPAGQGKAPKDIADVASVESHAGADKDKTYFLIGHDAKAKAPRSGYRLMLVLPGGTGARDKESFCKRIYKFALSSDYIVAQLVSKMWRDDQKIIWPREKKRVAKMKFSTEEFIDAVIEDVESQIKIDRSHIFTLTWSSSGPAAYAAALAKKSRITGSFIAMSVFKPLQGRLKLSNGRGRSFYIYHSETDRRCPIRMARDAEVKLTKAKAKVEFATYSGGYTLGHPRVWLDMKKGVAWLEKNHSKARKHKKPKKRKALRPSKRPSKRPSERQMAP